MCDCDPPKCWRRSTPRARKAHRCCECRGIIPVGEVYHVFSGIWDDPATFKTCIVCETIRAGMQDRTNECVGFGLLLEFLLESHQTPSLWFVKWIANAEARGVTVAQFIKDACEHLRLLGQ